MKSIAKLLLKFVLTLLCISFLSFLLLYLAPGDPAESILSAQGIPYTQELLELKRTEFGLNDPFIVQYGNWLWKILHGDFGTTFNSGAPVFDQLMFYFPNTIKLALAILSTTLFFSIPLAWFGAYYHQSKWDRLLMTVVGFFNAIPNFVIGILLIVIFSVQLKWFPVQSTTNATGIVLPVVTMAIIMSTRYIPQLRTAFVEELESPHVQGARGRGIPEWRIFIFDICFNVLPFLLTLIGLSFSSLVGGVAIIEHLFSWPGIGKLMIATAEKRDFPLIQGIILIVTAGILTINLVNQLMIRWINPHTRLKEHAPNKQFTKKVAKIAQENGGAR